MLLLLLLLLLLKLLNSSTTTTLPMSIRSKIEVHGPHGACIHAATTRPLDVRVPRALFLVPWSALLRQ